MVSYDEEVSTLQKSVEGIHHITAITADARANVNFYARILGLRLVKKTVNFDAPDVYHLYYGDESGTPGTILTFFEFPDAAPGRHGDGMIHTVRWALASRNSLEFWAERIAATGMDFSMSDEALTLEDPEGMGIELAIVDGAGNARAQWSDIPPEHAVRGFAGVRAYASRPEASDEALTEVLGFEPNGDSAYSSVGPAGHEITLAYEAPPGRGIQGAGSIHHIAWAVEPDDQPAWRRKVAEAELGPTPIIDRYYFRSVYFREPSGVLFELATKGPGFTVDEPLDKLGEQLKLPPKYEPMRAQLERRLTPLVNPRSSGGAD